MKKLVLHVVVQDYVPLVMVKVQLDKVTEYQKCVLVAGEMVSVETVSVLASNNAGLAADKIINIGKNVKKDIIISVSVIILGLLIALSPKFLFKVCSPEMMSVTSAGAAINNSCCGDAANGIISDCCGNNDTNYNNSDNNTVIIGACGGPCGIGCGCGNSGNCVGEGCGTLGGICGEGKPIQNDGCGNQHGSCGGKCGSDKTITYPACHWTAQAELALGFLIAALGLCMIVFDDLKTKLGIIISVFFSGIVVLFIPHGLIGGCGMMTMACRSAAFPVITILGVVLLVVSAVYVVCIIKKAPIENSEG